MTQQTYILLNLIATLTAIAGLIMPAIIIYFTAVHKNYFALILTVVIFSLTYFIVGEQAAMLLPLVLPLVTAALLGSFLRSKGTDFWSSMGYMIAGELFGIIVGFVLVYFLFGRQDIATLLAEGYRNSFAGMAPDDATGNYVLDFLNYIYSYALTGSLQAIDFTEVYDIPAKLEIVIPQMKSLIAYSLPTLVMSYGVISGIIAWFLSSLMLAVRAKKSKKLLGAKDFKVPPEFSTWQMPRWFVNTMMLLLLSAFLIIMAESESLRSVASAVQSSVLIVISIQGLAVVNWWLKKKKLKGAPVIIITALILIFLFFTLPWLGMADVIFSIRTMGERKEILKKRMDELKKQVDDKMDELEKNSKTNDDDQSEENDDNKNESEDKK